MNKFLLLPLLFMFSCNSGPKLKKYIAYNLKTGQKIIWTPMFSDNEIKYKKGDTVIEKSYWITNGKENSREDKCLIVKNIE